MRVDVDKREAYRVTIDTLYMPDTAPGEKSAVSQTWTRFGTKRDVAAMLQLSVRSVDNLVAAGCPVLRIGKRRCRFDLLEVAAWVKERYGQQLRRPRIVRQVELAQ